MSNQTVRYTHFAFCIVPCKNIEVERSVCDIASIMKRPFVLRKKDMLLKIQRMVRQSNKNSFKNFNITKSQASLGFFYFGQKEKARNNFLLFCILSSYYTLFSPKSQSRTNFSLALPISALRLWKVSAGSILWVISV